MVSKKSVHQTTLVGRDDFRCVVFISCPSGLLSTCQLSWPSDPKLVESLWAWNNSFILLRLETWSPLLVCMAWNGSFILLVDPKIKGRRLGVLYLYVWLGMVALYYQWTQKLKVGDLESSTCMYGLETWRLVLDTTASARQLMRHGLNESNWFLFLRETH